MTRLGRATALWTLALACLSPSSAWAQDTDGDGIPNAADNCTTKPNSSQLDTNADGYGNACDPDYNNNGGVETADYLRMGGAFGSHSGDPNYDPDIDSTGDGDIDSLEYLLVGSYFGKPPGPSGLTCAGTIPCRDGDLDTVHDGLDNCIDVANVDQTDPDGDGCGVACDADYDNDGFTHPDDMLMIRTAFGATAGQPAFDADMDHDGDGEIGLPDLLFLGARVGDAPGPGQCAAGSPDTPLIPGSGLPQYQQLAAMPVPGGTVNTAGGTFATQRVDLSFDTLLGVQQIRATYSSFWGRWWWNFDMAYTGEYFLDGTGQVYDVRSIPDGNPIPGTAWVKVDEDTLKTKGGLVQRVRRRQRPPALVDPVGERPASADRVHPNGGPRHGAYHSRDLVQW